MKNFNNPMHPQYMQTYGVGGYQQPQGAFAQRGGPMQYQQHMMNNQDLMYDDDYYDEELDTEEAVYQEALRMQAAGLQPSNMMMAANQDAAIQRAEAMLGDGFEIMEEELDEDYEPTGDEIEEYAKYLGMDLNDDKDLFYIAKEGLKAPLPNPWKPCKSPGGNIYYFNFQSQELQKEHPCDNYYKDYYVREKGNQRRKKEEQAIKKQIKEQQKKQKMSNSMSSSNPHPNASVGNTSINQMALMMNMSGLDVSGTSFVNERVQQEVEQIMEDFEEKKIQHERKRREELKKLEQDKTKEKQQIQDDYKLQSELLKKTAFKPQSQTDLIQRRKTELQIEKDKRLRELRELERSKLLKNEKQTEAKFDKKRDEFKKDEERRHQMEADNVKQLYANKLQIEREKIRDENNRLLEESGDIDFQVRLFKSEMLDGQVDTQKYEIEEELRQKIKDQKAENKKRIEKERERIIANFETKLEKEKEKEARRQKLEMSKIEDKKEQLKKEYMLKIKEEKRKVEKEFNEKLRNKRLEEDDDMDHSKLELKKSIAKTYEVREQRIEKEFEKARSDIKAQQEKYENEKNQKFEDDKEDIEQEYLEQWEEEKADFTKNENEKSESYQAIIKEIQQAKQKLKDLQNKELKLTKDLKQKQKEISDFEMEKRGKERQLKSNHANSQVDDFELRQLQKELKEKQDELDRLQLMIADKKDQIRRRGQKVQGDQGLFHNEDYFRLAKDLDSVKLMIMDLKSGNDLRQASPSKQQQRKPVTSHSYDYSLSEIEAFIDLHLPKLKHKREKHDQDRLILRQLIANIERNRMKLRKDINSNLSNSNRIAIQSIKDKIDEQARILDEEEKQIKDKSDYYRRKEEKLRVMKQKIDIIRGNNDRYENELEEDRKDALMREIQIDYDKYLKLYQKDDEHLGKKKTTIRNQEMLAFQDKWADYLIEEANDDLKPLIGLDPSRELFKPKYLHKKYEMSGSKYNHRLAFNHIYDREIEKVKENRHRMKDFLDNQQKWLSQMRNELSGGIGAVPVSKPMMNYVKSSETLFHLRGNLSPVLANY